MGIGVYGPALDKKGNSLAGGHLLADLSEELFFKYFLVFRSNYFLYKGGWIMEFLNSIVGQIKQHFYGLMFLSHF